jgi:hypothetical protein
VHVLHRDAPDDRRDILGIRIAAIRSAGIELVPEAEEGDTIFVPYHRFLAIFGPDGMLWSKEAGAITDPHRRSAAVRPAFSSRSR